MLLNLKKTFSCNALSPSITVFFKRNNFSQNHFHFLSLDIQKILLRCNPLSLSLPNVGIRPDCPAWEQLSSVFGLVLRRKEASLSTCTETCTVLVLRRKEASLSSTERLSFNQPGRSVICPCDEAGSGKSRHCSFWKAAREGLLIEQQYQVLAVNVAYFSAVFFTFVMEHNK